MNNYFWDENSVRYNLINFINDNRVAYNWLFLPGGPGLDSSYLKDLGTQLELPGNTWLIDLPNNGSNQISDVYDYDSWFDLLLPIINKFPNAILVGQSFGGMFPLLFTQLENALKGLVILNSAPAGWQDESSRVAKEKNILTNDRELKEFSANSNNTTFKKLLLACAPYFFPNNTLEKGRQILANIEFNYHATAWWQKKVVDINFTAKWIPNKVNTLIIGGTEDCMTPPSIFLKDKRFARGNITHVIIENAGHMPWVEDMPAVKSAFDDFLQVL